MTLQRRQKKNRHIIRLDCLRGGPSWITRNISRRLPHRAVPSNNARSGVKAIWQRLGGLAQPEKVSARLLVSGI